MRKHFPTSKIAIISIITLYIQGNKLFECSSDIVRSGYPYRYGTCGLIDKTPNPGIAITIAAQFIQRIQVLLFTASVISHTFVVHGFGPVVIFIGEDYNQRRRRSVNFRRFKRFWCHSTPVWLLCVFLNCQIPITRQKRNTFINMSLPIG